MIIRLVMSRVCTQCNTEKIIGEYFLTNRGYPRPECKSCSRKMCCEYKRKNREKISEYNKEYKAEHKAEVSDYNRTYNIENRESIQKRQTAQHIIRRNIDPAYKFSINIRGRLNSVFKNKHNKPTTKKLLGCEYSFLVEWFEYLYAHDMNFANYGTLWHIDHVIPCCKIDINNTDDVQLCSHWSNLRPCYANVNLSKNGKIDENAIADHVNNLELYLSINNMKKDDALFLSRYEEFLE